MTAGTDRARRYAAAGVDIEAGDRAVELMKAWVAKASRPEVVGGIGGFAGLFDASALQGLPAAAARDLHRRRRHQGRRRRSRWTARHDRPRPGRHGRRRPGGLRRRAAVHDRLHRLRQGRARADRRDRQGHRRGLRARRLRAGRRRDRGAPRAARARTSTTWPAPAPASSRPTGCSARTGSAPATCWSRWRPAACTPTATRWCGTCCSSAAGWQLDRHVDELGRAARRGAARADPDLRPRLPGADRRRSRCTRSATSPAAGWPPTWPGCCRRTLTRDVDRATWSPAPVFGLVGDVGGVAGGRARAHPEHGRRAWSPWWRRTTPTRAVRLLADRGVPAWIGRSGRAPGIGRGGAGGAAPRRRDRRSARGRRPVVLVEVVVLAVATVIEAPGRDRLRALAARRSRSVP